MKSWKSELNFGVQLADVYSPDMTQDSWSWSWSWSAVGIPTIRISFALAWNVPADPRGPAPNLAFKQMCTSPHALAQSPVNHA